MDKFSKTLLALATISIAYQLTVTAAPAKIGEPLTFYPISPKTYDSLLGIITKQLATPEERMLDARHLTITPWTVSLPQGWDGGLTIDHPPLSVGHKPVRGYPLCVLKVNGTRKGKRGNRRGRQFEDTYAGLAPTVVYTPPGYPQYAYGPPGYEHHPPGYVHHPPGYEHPTHRPPGHEHPTHRPHHPDQVITIPSIGKNGQKAVVNCVLVLHGGTGHPKPSTTTPKPDKIVPPYGYPFPHPHPYPPPPPPFGYYPPPYGYPPYGYPGPYPPPPPTFTPKPEVRNLHANKEQMDPEMFQEMLDEYYPPLGDMYAIHTSTSNAEVVADADDSSIEDSKESHDNRF